MKNTHAGMWQFFTIGASILLGDLRVHELEVNLFVNNDFQYKILVLAQLSVSCIDNAIDPGLRIIAQIRPDCENIIQRWITHINIICRIG